MTTFFEDGLSNTNISKQLTPTHNFDLASVIAEEIRNNPRYVVIDMMFTSFGASVTILDKNFNQIYEITTKCIKEKIS